MQRYFLGNNRLSGNFIHVAGDDFHHIVHVMRMKTGDLVEVVFPGRKIAACKIERITKEAVELEIIGFREEDREMPVQITIASALIKGDKFDYVIQKGTELGAKAFMPFESERTIVKLDGNKAKRKAERWKKVAKEAAEQSERNEIPTIYHPVSFHECLLHGAAYTKKLAAYEMEGRKLERGRFFKEISEMNPGDSLMILFGPEGGFSDSEIEKLIERGFTLCGLGPRILRAETAPLYALSAISFYFELMR